MIYIVHASPKGLGESRGLASHPAKGWTVNPVRLWKQQTVRFSATPAVLDGEVESEGQWQG